MEVHREVLALRQQQRGQLPDPAGEQLLLLTTLGAVGVVGGVGGLGQDIQASEQAEGLIEVEIADMAPSFFITSANKILTVQWAAAYLTLG
jgi:hypothetical protein